MPGPSLAKKSYESIKASSAAGGSQTCVFVCVLVIPLVLDATLLPSCSSSTVVQPGVTKWRNKKLQNVFTSSHMCGPGCVCTTISPLHYCCNTGTTYLLLHKYTYVPEERVD